MNNQKNLITLYEQLLSDKFDMVCAQEPYSFKNIFSSKTLVIRNHTDFRCASFYVDQNLRVFAEKRKDIFHHLKLLMTELDESKVVKMLDKFKQVLLEEKELKFYKYFTEDYGKKYKEWACAFRKELQINTNMAVESVHKIIKLDIFNGRVVKRLDKTIKLILDYLDDKQHDQLVKQYKGKNTKRSTVIWKNHQVTIKRFNNYQIEPIGGNFILKSTSGRQYTVGLKEGGCSYQECGLQCNKCNICLHTITYSCYDSATLFEMCIHCHVLAMWNKICCQIHLTACDHTHT